jgi:hypothetical protein
VKSVDITQEYEPARFLNRIEQSMRQRFEVGMDVAQEPDPAQSVVVVAVKLRQIT